MSHQPITERVLELDGKPITLRMQIATGNGVAAVAPLGVFPVLRLTIGRDSEGAYLSAHCAADQAGEPSQFRQLAS